MKHVYAFDYADLADDEPKPIRPDSVRWPEKHLIAESFDEGVAMTARPILFSGPMIRALLASQKTQTRRALKTQPVDILPMPKAPGREWVTLEQREPEPRGKVIRCRFGVPGDLLWARETWQHAPQKFCSCPQPSEPSPCDDWSEGTGCQSNRGHVVYAADGASVSRWRPSIFMPRWASRITLRITEVRVQRLQEINEADADAEGFGGNFPHVVMPDVFPDADAAGRLSIVECYGRLWEHINGAGSWSANPWCWCLTFEVIKANVDDVMRSKAA